MSESEGEVRLVRRFSPVLVVPGSGQAGQVPQLVLSPQAGGRAGQELIVQSNDLINEVIVGSDVSPLPELPDHVQQGPVPDQDHVGHGQDGGPADPHLAVDDDLPSSLQSRVDKLRCWAKVSGYVTAKSIPETEPLQAVEKVM